MRKYQPIWEQLKQVNTVSIAADPCLHDRIAKGVKKEKDKDLGWRLLHAEQGKKSKLKIDKEGKAVTFTLVDCTPLKLSDL